MLLAPWQQVSEDPVSMVTRSYDSSKEGSGGALATLPLKEDGASAQPELNHELFASVLNSTTVSPILVLHHSGIV